LSYTFLGEWVTGLCYGPGVFVCFWLLAGLTIEPATALGALAFAALAMALLLSHQPPQIETDRAAGKQSFAARYGALRTYQTARWLAVLFIVSTGIGIESGENPPATIAVFALTGIAAIVFLWGAQPNPGRILLPSTAVIVASLVVNVM
jgi:1,4-dihydroxy-2-naphthoate octaprenyltransferase